MKVLVVEDHADLRQSLVEVLEDELYAVDQAEDGEVGLYKAVNWDYDCVVLDVMLPKKSGFEVVAELRKEKKTPVLMLTARDAVEDRVLGLDSGADDYLVKPFEVIELLARVRSLIRRTSRDVSPFLYLGNLTVDLNKKVIMMEDAVVDLTGKEYAMAELMIHQRGKVVTRDYLYEHLFDEEDESISNLLDVFIYRLRKKLGKDFIKTRRGQGYIVE